MADKSKNKKPRFTKLDQRIYNAITPRGYSDEMPIRKALIPVLKKASRTQDTPDREELWKHVLGSNDKLTQFEESPYKPSISTDPNSKYLRHKYIKKSGTTVDNIISAIDNMGDSTTVTGRFPLPLKRGVTYLSVDTPGEFVKETDVLANLKFSKGEDEKGKYVSYYDKWDFGKLANLYTDRKPEIYDRIYYKEHKNIPIGEVGRYTVVPEYKNGGAMKKKLPAVKPTYTINLTEEQLYDLGGWMDENSNTLSGVASGAASGASMGSVIGPWGTAAGAVIGGVLGGISGNKADQEEGNLIDYSKEIVGPRNVGVRNMTPNVMHFKKGGDTKVAKVMREFKKGKLHSGSKKGPIVKNRKQAIAIALSEAGLSKYAEGGMMDDELMKIEGPSHEQGGVQFREGIEVEGGETIKDNIVNSDSWIITKDIAENYGLPKKAVGKTAADYSKSVEKKYKGRDGDPFAMKSMEMEQNNISRMSKEVAEIMDSSKNEYQEGGKIWRPEDYLYDPRFINTARTLSTDKYTNIVDPSKPLNWWSNTIKSGVNNFATDIVGDMYQDLFKQGFARDKNIEEQVLQNNIKTTKPTEGITTLPQVTVTANRNKSTGTKPSNFIENGAMPYGIKDVVYNPPSGAMDISYDKAIADTDKNISHVNYKKLAFEFTDAGATPRGKVSTPLTTPINKTTDWGNVGQTALGLAPMAIGAFQAARSANEGYDKVKLPRLIYDDVNPQFIDPAYQVQQAQDAFATGNEQMSQMSRKDWLRRRIQSATEEAKTTSGIRGQATAMNADIRNRADMFNAQNKQQSDAMNLQATMQEEQINAANKGAWQSNRDFQLNNLATMAGEYGRDLRLEEANNLYNEKVIGTLKEIGKGPGIGFNAKGIPFRTNETGTAINSDISFGDMNYPINQAYQYPGAIDMETNNYKGFDYRLRPPRYNQLTGKYII